MLHYTTLCYVTLHHATLCYVSCVMLHHVTSRHIMACHVAAHHVMLSYATLCYIRNDYLNFDFYILEILDHGRHEYLPQLPSGSYTSHWQGSVRLVWKYFFYKFCHVFALNF